MSITATIISDHRQDTVEVGDDESLLGALQRTGWHLPAPCGGTGRCGTGCWKLKMKPKVKGVWLYSSI